MIILIRMLHVECLPKARSRAIVWFRICERREAPTPPQPCSNPEPLLAEEVWLLVCKYIIGRNRTCRLLVPL